MSAQSEFHAALESGDVRLVRRASARLFPHLPPPASDNEAEASMHMARTQMPSMPLKLRVYSHRWLAERGLPSQLPDDLRPKVEQIHPVIAEGVLVAVDSQSEEMKPIAKLIEAAMCDAVEDCYANGDRDPRIVKARMAEAKARKFRELLGTTAGAR